MRSLAKPNPEYNYDPDVEIQELINYRDQHRANSTELRKIPNKGQDDNLLIGSWNIANLGVHKRRPIDFKVIAEIISWFEIIAVQEVADNLANLLGIMANLPNNYKCIFNDRAGNDERSAYIYDSNVVSLGPKIGEVVIVESDRKYIKIDGVENFIGFNRNPYLVSFIIGDVRLLFANCHLLYGTQTTTAERKLSLERRQLEAYAIARWCDLRRGDKHRWTKNIIALGDFNIPMAQKGDQVYDALTARGLRTPLHDSRVPHTNVSNNSDYDQITVTPGLISKIVHKGVFDFDGAIFKDIWNARSPGRWRTCTKYYISDHRPIWFQLNLNGLENQ